MVFICRDDPRRSGILPFPDCPRYCRLMKTRNRRYPRSSGMDGDKSGESGAFLFSRRVPDFCDGRQSFPTNENSNLLRRGCRRWISFIKPGFHMSGKSQTIGAFTFYRPSQIYRIIATILSLILPIEFGRKWKVRQKLKLAWWGDWSRAIWGIGNDRHPSPRSPTIQIWVFICREWSPTIAEIWDASGK